MGQAKKRGTFEERLKLAAERDRSMQAERDRIADLEYAERCKTRPPQSLNTSMRRSPYSGVPMIATLLAAAMGSSQTKKEVKRA